jgi:curved DNA-binding protein CbpA
MEENKNKIFSIYYIERSKKIIGPLRYEQLKELMYNKQFLGNEKISEDQENWLPIRSVLVDLDSFLSAEQEEKYNETFLDLINKKTEYRIKTTFNIVMGPFDNQKLMNMIEQEKIELDYDIMTQDMSVTFRKIKKRLFNKVEKILTEETESEKVEEKAQKVGGQNIGAQNIEPIQRGEKKVEKEDLDEFENIKSVDLSEINNDITQSPIIETKKVQKLSEENIKGLLSSKPLLSLLFTYSLDKLTGILEITRKSDLYEISFKKGKLAYINSNKIDLSLPRFLKEKKNIITNYDESLPDSAVIPKLISERKIEASQIYDLLKEVIIYRLQKIFEVINGKFLFKEDVTTSDTSLNIDFLSNIWNLTSKLIPIDIIDDYINKIEDFVIVKDERKFSYNEYLKLGPIEFKLLSKINNKITTKQFITLLEKQKKELLVTFKRLVYILYNLRFIIKGDLVNSRDVYKEISDLKELISKIEKENNHFVTLGVPEDASLAQIRKIYIKAARDYHPDKLSKEENQELRELKTKYYTYISTSYNKISTQEALDQYILEMNSEFSNNENFDAESLFKAEELFNMCKKAIKVGKFERALDFVDKAISMFNSNQEFKVYKYYLDFVFAWQENPAKAKTILMNLEELMKKMEKYSEGYRFLGRMYKTLKDDSKARLNFKKLFLLIPYDTEAKRESR